LFCKHFSLETAQVAALSAQVAALAAQVAALGAHGRLTVEARACVLRAIGYGSVGLTSWV